MTIKARSLRKEFDTPDGTVTAVNGIDLTIGEHEFITLVGPSGCGKTTTLRCFAGLETPTSGSILINGEDVTDIPPNKRNLAMMFQNIALYPHMRIQENIAYPLKVMGVDKETRHEEARDAAELMQISDLLKKYPAELSGGQRQRAALARTIVQDPEAFLMDEPLSDLDAKLKVEVRKEIQKVHKRVNKPTLYVTHDQEEAMTMSDRIVVMNKGDIEQIGTPDELYTEPENMFVAEFIGNPSMNFIPGELVSIDDSNATVSVPNQTLEIPIQPVGDTTATEGITVGFRPETVELDPSGEEGYFTGIVTLVERIGDRMQATVDGPEGELRATVSADHSLVEDETVAISFDRSQVHLFDRETGEVIARGVTQNKAMTQ